jgi:plastocyanin
MMATTKLTFKSVSSHVEDLSDGRTVAPGDSVTLTTEESKDPHNARLIDEGVFIAVEETSDSKKGGSN